MSLCCDLAVVAMRCEAVHDPRSAGLCSDEANREIDLQLSAVALAILPQTVSRFIASAIESSRLPSGGFAYRSCLLCFYRRNSGILGTHRNLQTKFDHAECLRRALRRGHPASELSISFLQHPDHAGLHPASEGTSPRWWFGGTSSFLVEVRLQAEDS